MSEIINANDLWRGLVFYLMLNHRDDYIFALYSVSHEQKAYGIEGSGIALFSPGSAALIPYGEKGLTYCFAGADSFIELERLIGEWSAIGKPNADQLRLRLTPKSAGLPEVTRGRVYDRADHYLHAWLETVEAEGAS